MAISRTSSLGLVPTWYQGICGLVLILAVLAINGIIKSLRWNFLVRRSYKDIPQTPRHWFWGHLISIGQKLDPAINHHPDYAFADVWEELGRPPAFLVDLAPIDRCMLLVADPRVAEAASQPTAEWKYSTPKSDTMRAFSRLVGDQSLIIIGGEAWRNQRRRFNKGFSPAHLSTLTPMIIEKTRIFLERMKSCARAGEPFALKGPAQDLTTDVITQVTLEKDFHAQTSPEGVGYKSTFGLLTVLKTMSSLTERVGQGFQFTSLLPQRRIKEFMFDKLYTRALHNEIVSTIPGHGKSSMNGKSVGNDYGSPTASSGKSIVNLSLAGLEPTPAVLYDTVCQMKSFMFAGQDTTSTVIQWMAYELSKSYPSSPLYTEHVRRVREQLCAEHDAAFGKSDPFSVLDTLADSGANVDEILGTKLPYTTAFIKEILRLHPPAGSARLPPMAPYDRWVSPSEPAKPFYLDLPEWTNSKTGERHEAKRVRADGLRFYNNHYIIHRNPNIWGDDAKVFDPARFLDLNNTMSSTNEIESYHEHEISLPGKNAPLADHTSHKEALPHPNHVSTLPAGSWRPFERGPRNCIGMNLAMIEAKIVLGVMARGFEWTKYGLNGRPDGYARVVEDKEVGEPKGWEVWNVNNVTAVPVDGMMMKVKLRQPEDVTH